MSKKNKDRRSDKGFSLIELIVVLVILGLLAAVVGPQILDKIGRGKQQIARIQIKEFEGALQMYALDTGRLPEGNEGLYALVQNVENLDAWNGPYLANELPTDPWQRDYVYVYPGNYGEYDIYSFGPDGVEGTEDDVCSWKK